MVTLSLLSSSVVITRCASTIGGSPQSVVRVLPRAWGTAGTARPRPFSIFRVFVFRFSFAEFRLEVHARCGALIQPKRRWRVGARLDAAQRHRFFEAFLNAALRLDKLELRAWLRRLKNPPLAAPFDPARLMFADADIALIMRAAGKAPGEAAAGPDRDEADGG